MEKTNSRIAMALFCGLAICCAVMYITADGAEVTPETILSTKREAAKSVYGIGGPTSVDSEDVEKAGEVVTNTPDGRMRLTDYLTNVEKEIAAEEAARKRDVAAVRAQMARNFAFNKSERTKLKKAMLAKMAVNAKKVKDDLARGMRWVQGKFAAFSKLSNSRHTANIKRSLALRATIAKNKIQAEKELQTAVLAQQRAMATLTEQTNSRIDSTNKHVGANAAAIKENAKKAREELEKTVAMFDKKVAAASSEASAGRDKLSQQLADQDKSIRQWANNKMKVVVAKTAAQFRRVREKMAEDREHADNQLKVATTSMTASLNAFKALNNDNFAKTVKDIAAAKAEAKARVAAAQQAFKVSLYRLSATIKDQVGKANTRIDQLTNTVTKNKIAQAKINTNVNAEIKRMIKIGNKRYKQHLKKDAELESLIKTNKAETDKQLDAMASHYMMEIDSVRHTMKKNRAHATHMLAKESAKLYSAIAKNEAEQMKTNSELAAQTRRARLDIKDALRVAKDDFADRIGSLHKTVADNDKKFEKKIDKLTGIVRKNAVRNANGRKELREMMDANKKELNKAVRDAIHKGETRMAAAEMKLMKLNKKTKAALNVKITAEISKLTKRANDQIEGLRLNSAEARKEMKKELLYAIRSMAEQAKDNLDDAVKVATTKFALVNAAEEKAAKESAADRVKIAEEIKNQKSAAERQIGDAVATMQRSLLALKTQTKKKIDKTNRRIDAYAKSLDKEAKDVARLMGQQKTLLLGKISAQKAKATAATKLAGSASNKAWDSIDKKVTDALDKAAKKSDKKFKKLYSEMAEQRATLDKNLAGSVRNINDSIAKQAALAQSNFEKTVKNIKAARAEAAKQVKQARQDFSTQLAAATATIKDMETKLTGEVQVVSGEVISHKAQQATVNRRTKAELKRIQKLMNDQHSISIKARGKLRAILDENKRAAAEETAALSKLFKSKIQSIRSEAAADREAAAKDLTDASEKAFAAMADAQKEQLYQNKLSAAAIGKYSAESLAAIATAKKEFGARLDTLTNVIGANHKKVEKGFEVLTGVIRDYKKAGAEERKLLRVQNDALNADMQKAITRAIQIGEAKATKVAQEAREHLAGAKKSMLVEITNSVEDMADKAFATIQGKHGKIADNYLSLKAYAITAESKLVEYTAKGKGKNLSSLGDLLVNIASLSDVKATPAEGISPSSELPQIFTGDKIKVDNSINKINNLVNEFVTQANACRERWPMGLGKYLLLKLYASMTGKGVLQVDKVDGRSGNWVFMNGHAVGLSNKLTDFEGLAVRMAHYETVLAGLTSTLSGKNHKSVKKYVPPPEWDGK